LFFRNAALNDALRQAFRPLKVSRVLSDLVKLKEGTSSACRTVAEAQVIHVGKIREAVGNQGRMAIHGCNALQVHSALFRGIEILGVLSRPVQTRKDIGHARGSPFEIREVGILRQAGKCRKAAPAQAPARLSDGSL